MIALILIAGTPTFDLNDGGFPVCLTEVNGSTLIEIIYNKIKRLSPSKVVFALRESDVEDYHLDQSVAQLGSNVLTVVVPNNTKGSACSALLASKFIDNDEPLLIVSANEVVEIDLSIALTSFTSARLSAGTIFFNSVHPRYSYIKFDEFKHIIEAKQNKAISNNATTGIFWFSKGASFVAAAKNMIRKDAQTDGNYYVCPTFNELILENKRIGGHYIDKSLYHPLKSSHQFQQFETYINSGSYKNA